MLNLGKGKHGTFIWLQRPVVERDFSNQYCVHGAQNESQRGISSWQRNENPRHLCLQQRDAMW